MRRPSPAAPTWRCVPGSDRATLAGVCIARLNHWHGDGHRATPESDHDWNAHKHRAQRQSDSTWARRKHLRLKCALRGMGTIGQGPSRKAPPKASQLYGMTRGTLRYPPATHIAERPGSDLDLAFLSPLHAGPQLLVLRAGAPRTHRRNVPRGTRKRSGKRRTSSTLFFPVNTRTRPNTQPQHTTLTPKIE